MEYKIEDFEKIIERLFSKDGCPWDKSQSFLSLRQSLLEEAYELIDACEKGNNDLIAEETGDLLLVALLYIFVGEHNNLFNRQDVYTTISEKMIHRHPHVFSDVDYDDWNWDELKKEEKKYSSNKEILELIPRCSPALLRGDKINKKMNKLFTPISIEDSKEYIKSNIDSTDEIDLANCLLAMSNIISKQDLSSEIILNSLLNKKISEL